jgi:N-acetylmuramoyl-L-alanine amidase
LRYTAGVLLALLTLAFAGPEVPPPNHLRAWEVAHRGEPGTRVAMIVETTDKRSVDVQIWNGTAWIGARETWRNETVAVLVADLGTTTDTVAFRSPDQARIRTLDWDLLVPLGENRSSSAPPTARRLPAELTAIGVVERADWGARSTTCTSTEDDWYRMAIHHTAGSQTYGGTVMGSVQALQAYSLDGGEYCDIPYQYLVGYDGSLWEGRPYGYTSGATGGGNNDGNAAVCFLGCYDTSCSGEDAVTEAMIDGAHTLVQTMVSLHDIPSDSDSIRGHRDWPDNATACPGSGVYARLDDLRAPLTPGYAAVFASQSFPLAHEGVVELTVGEELTGYIELTNTGTATWDSATMLATIPRDTPSSLADETWVSPTRTVAVDAATATGENGRFTFTIQGNAAGEYDQYFSLVQESVTWFADDGGPGEDTLRVRVVVTEAPVVVDSGDDTAPAVDDTDGPAATGDGAPMPGRAVGFDQLGGCGCGGGGSASAGLTLLLVALSRRRDDFRTLRL